jgi:hypothetical protein
MAECVRLDFWVLLLPAADAMTMACANSTRCMLQSPTLHARLMHCARQQCLHHALQGSAVGGKTGTCSGELGAGGGGHGGGSSWSARPTDKIFGRTTPAARSLIGWQPHAGALVARIGSAAVVST